MASLVESLLESGGHDLTDASPKSWRRALARTAAAAGAACGAVSLAAGLFLGGAEYATVATPLAGGVVAVALGTRNAGEAGAATNLPARLDLDCYAFTGGKCRTGACDIGRNAVCEGGHCVCSSDSCAGIDGICHRGATNALVAAGFTLRNAKFVDQTMYMPAPRFLMQIKTGAVPSVADADRWTLHEMPGKTLVGGKRSYLLSTVAFPGFVATTQPTLGTAISPFAAYEVGLAAEKSPTVIAVRACSRGDGSIMIGSPGWSSPNITQWFYVHRFSWRVLTWPGDPGTGGYWVAEPPLPTGSVDPCGKL